MILLINHYIITHVLISLKTVTLCKFLVMVFQWSNIVTDFEDTMTIHTMHAKLKLPF